MRDPPDYRGGVVTAKLPIKKADVLIVAGGFLVVFGLVVLLSLWLRWAGVR